MIAPEWGLFGRTASNAARIEGRVSGVSAIETLPPGSSPTPDSRLPTPHSDVRRLSDEANRWLVAEGELRARLNGVAGANLIRRQRIALIASQAFNIGTQLARDPANAVLVPHLEEVKRLKSIKRRKHAAPVPPTPAPVPVTSKTPQT